MDFPRAAYFFHVPHFVASDNNSFGFQDDQLMVVHGGVVTREEYFKLRFFHFSFFLGHYFILISQKYKTGRGANFKIIPGYGPFW
jgi:hypothetical protein